MIEKLTHGLGRVPLMSNALRWYANRFDEGSVVKIRQGLAADLLWKRSHRYVNGYWIGHYEFQIQHALKLLLKRGWTFFDIGANAGFFTLIGSRIVGNDGRCIAFEPSTINVESIRQQLELNCISNCQIIAEALSDFEGESEFFFPSPGSPVGHLGRSQSGEQCIRVRVATLDSAARRFGPPQLVKMDVEGAEVDALRGACELLRTSPPIWLIELHNETCERDVKRILTNAHYNFFDLGMRQLNPADILPGHIVAKPQT